MITIPIDPRACGKTALAALILLLAQAGGCVREDGSDYQVKAMLTQETDDAGESRKSSRDP